MVKYFLILLLALTFNVNADPKVRPDNWAIPIINTSLVNLHIIDKNIYRSSQPEEKDIEDLKALGIKEILNLRYFHNNNGEIKNAGFKLHRVGMNAFTINEEQLIKALRMIKDRKGPLLVHCWHGSDRTGTTIAAYRIVFNNWSKQQALDEMINGGFGYHDSMFPNLVTLINELDINKIRKSLGIKEVKD